MTPEEREKYYNLCNADEPLAADDARLVEIDLYGKDDTLARGYDWVEEMASAIELSRSSVRELFTGLPGSGKSTVLKRLTKRLGECSNGGFLCVPIDATVRFDLNAPIEVPDVLVMVAYEIECAVLRAEGEDPSKALTDGYLTRFWTWLKRTDVEFEKFELGAVAEAGDGKNKASIGPKVVLGLRSNPSLRQRLHATVEQHMTTFLGEVREEIGTLHDRARGRGRRGVVVILDSLEKLSGISTNFEDVLASAERLFASGALNLRLLREDPGGPLPRLVHAIYTVPPALALRRAITGLRFMPMIKLRERDRLDEFEPGYMAARELIRKRVPDTVLAGIFGESVCERRARELIRWSGGYPREIVRLLKTMVAQTAVVNERLFRRLLSTAGDDYRRTVPLEAVPWLARVALDRKLTVENDDHRKAVDQLISNNVVLRYQNDREWFDLHPAVADMEEIVEARNALLAAREEARKRAASGAQP